MLDEVLFVDSTHDLAVFTVSPVKTDTYKAVAAQIYLSTMREITLSKRGEKIQKIRESDTYQKDLITRHTSPYYLKTKEEEATDSNEVLSIFGYPETIFESYAGQSTLLLDYQSLLISKNISSSRVGISGGPVINKANKLVGIAHSSSKQDYNKILFSSSQSLIAIYNRTTGTDCKEFLLLKECMLTAIRHTLSKAEQGDATSQFQIKLGGDHFSSF